MYQSSYAEILAESAETTRAGEWQVLDHAVTLLRRANEALPGSQAQRDATSYVIQLWGLLVKSLTSPENDLPGPLRADLVSIGLGVMAEASRIDKGESRDFAGLADICGIIRDGLT
jgi:flagellar protein FlaF